MSDTAWIAVIILIGVLAFVFGRKTSAQRPDDQYDVEPKRERVSSKPASKRASWDGSAIELTQSVSDEVDKLIRSGKVINAIKMVRDASGASLKPSKEYVDLRREELE